MPTWPEHLIVVHTASLIGSLVDVNEDGSLARPGEAPKTTSTMDVDFPGAPTSLIDTNPACWCPSRAMRYVSLDALLKDLVKKREEESKNTLKRLRA
jgi:hypothetical protein